MTTKLQKEIIAHVRRLGGMMTKREAVEAFGSRYYCNADFHVGEVLSRMVAAGMLVRESRGVYKIGNGKRPAEILDSGQTELFK